MKKLKLSEAEWAELHDTLERPLPSTQYLMFTVEYLDLISPEPTEQERVKQELIDRFGYLPEALWLSGGGIFPVK
jgi:hypothetical protein